MLVKQSTTRWGVWEWSMSTSGTCIGSTSECPSKRRWAQWLKLSAEASVLPARRELGIGFVPFSPLGRGFLSARLRSREALPPDDFRHGLPRFQGANFMRNLDLAERLQALAARKGCTPAQLALAWLL